MDDLIRWLRAQIDEDERIVRAASVGPWKVAKVVEYLNIGCCDAIVDDANDQHVIPPDVDYGPSVDLADCEHIARHDPARVLREVEAKRKRIKLHEDVHDCPGIDWSHHEAGEPCPTLRLEALPFDDRPGYQESWRP